MNPKFDREISRLPSRSIKLSGVRQNNLKNINVEFPAKSLTVVTGLSGSGKSSLVFDTLYAEGQRRYIESLSTYTRQFLEKMPKPDLDQIQNIPPAIALEQRNHIINSRSTVSTQTEIVDYLRLLFSKVGKTFCLSCNGEVKRLDAESIIQWAVGWLPNRKILIIAPLIVQTKKSTKSRSVLEVLKEQGFHRVLLKTPNKKPELLDIQEASSIKKIKTDNITKREVYIVIDRLKVTTVDSETRTRLLDSVEQAASVGRGSLEFFDLDTSESQNFTNRYACVACGREHRIPEPQLFSFNSPIGACEHCNGFGHTLELDEALVVPDPSKTLRNGAVDPFTKPSAKDWQEAMLRFAERHSISVTKRYLELTHEERKLLWYGHPKDRTFAGISGCFEELKRWKYKLYVRVFIRRYQTQYLCPECGGARVKPEALAVKVGRNSIAEVLNRTITDCLDWMEKLQLSERELVISSDIRSQVLRRLEFLKEVGVGYLTLSRLAKTLSGGEFQRINLATQLGNGLCGTLYVLDEPSIGLHASDTQKLIRVLKKLKDQGNTVVVVEHDLDVMKEADWLVELGPGSGKRGGHVITQGTPSDLIAANSTLTSKYLAGTAQIRPNQTERAKATRTLILTGCKENNLRDISVEFPLNRFVVVTGVSGSGKSTLVHKTLYNAMARLFYRKNLQPGSYDKLYGAEQLGGVVLLDQAPIGKTSRSNPATYIKAWDEVRRIYANQVLALRRSYTPQHFSFNVDGGRCPVCKGEGQVTLDMHFMAELKLPCEECNGKRFKKNVLDITYRGKDINQLLHTTIDEAFEIFRDNPTLVRKLGILREVGLGYLELGQSATTLSGGESQRLKIAAVLDDKTTNNLLYVFDEPTTGLHHEDIRKLLSVIQNLIDAGHSVIMIEHHLDVIAQADWIIDLGPGGGSNGGEVVASGPPGKLIKSELSESMTAVMLRKQYNAYFSTSGATNGESIIV